MIPGTAAPWTPDKAGYEAFYAAWLCRYELLAQAEWIVLVGTSYAQSEDDVPAGMFQTVYEDESVAFEAMVRTNNARDMARARRQMAARRAGVQTRSLFG